MPINSFKKNFAKIDTKKGHEKNKAFAVAKGIYVREIKKAENAKKFEELVIAEIKNPYAGKGWIKEGLGWAFFMFVFMNFVFPLIKEETVTLNKVLISIPIWILGGLSFGYTMKKYYNRQIKERESYFR